MPMLETPGVNRARSSTLLASRPPKTTDRLMTYGATWPEDSEETRKEPRCIGADCRRSLLTVMI